MPFSRRKFIESSALAVLGREALMPLSAAPVAGYRPKLLLSRKEAWDSLVWMAKLGPKYTGNPAHTQFVEWLATQLKSSGLEVERINYKFPRWDAKRWELTIAPASGKSFKAPVTSYFQY